MANGNGTSGHELELVDVQDLKATLKKGGNKGLFNEATCSTAAATTAKTVTAPASFSLVSGATILVTFTNGISVDNATLAVGSTAAKPIYYKGAALEAGYVEAGDVIILRYDGTSYNVVGKLGGRALPEVQIGGNTPSLESEIKLYVDTDADPASAINIYNKTQVDTLLDGKLSNPIELTSLSGDYVFKDGDTLVVGTGLYKCNVATTTTPPFNFVFDEGGSIVIDSINGCEAVVVDSDTLNTGWEKVADVSDRHYTEMRVATKADKATTAAGYGIIDVYTKNQIDALTRHTRKTDFDLNDLKKAVADQNLEKYGLKVGDEKTINGHTYVIAELNPMKGVITPYRLTQNHVGLIVIPHTAQAWNVSGNTSTGADNRGAGYLNCDLHYYLKNTLLPLVNTDLGAANLLGHSKLLSNAVTDGKASGWTWEAGCKICALSEVQVYGSRVWSSSPYDVGEACRQLEVFQRFSHTEIFGSEFSWLRDVVSASHAAGAGHTGYAGDTTASGALSVAALILFH